MNYKKHFNYFHSKDQWYYIGLPIAILGCILVVGALFFFFVIPYQMPIGMTVAAIGASIAFLPYARCSKESEIDEAVCLASEDYSKQISERLSLENQLAKNTKPLTVGGYMYEDDLLMRRGRTDRICRTSKYSVAKIFCTKYGLVVAGKSFSLIEESENERMDSYSFSDMDRVAVTDEQFVCKDGSKIKVSFLVITKDNKELLRLPVKHDVAIDQLCHTVNEMIRKANT
ncbi:MAG: hypothetical protein IJD59_03650 [Clostridia bacterium]|nr:hypothetical protein [Clostridia bacterium]